MVCRAHHPHPPRRRRADLAGPTGATMTMSEGLACLVGFVEGLDSRKSERAPLKAGVPLLVATFADANRRNDPQADC